MPTEAKVKASWADQVDDDDDGSIGGNQDDSDDFPPPTETIEDNIKTVVEYSLDEDGKKIKITRLFRIETRHVSKSIARRKNLKKFGASHKDKPGPNSATTIAAEDVFMQFLSNKEEEKQLDTDDPLKKLKGQGTKMVKCRICKDDHWTTQCPYKDTLGPLQESLKGEEKNPGGAPEPAAGDDKNKAGRYVPPSMREGGNRRGEAMQPSGRADEGATIRVTNLSEDARETDLQELFKPFGPISRVFLAKDKITGHSKGFAFINFHNREHAARAIASVSGFGYDHLILNVEWAKPSTTQ